MRKRPWLGMAGLVIATGGAAAQSAPPGTPPRGDTAVAGFDRSLLAGAGANTADLSRFERGNLVLPGRYSVDLYLNRNPVGRGEVRFAARDPQADATPCIDRALFDQLGLPSGKLTAAQFAAMGDPAACVDLASLVPGAGMHFDMADLRLDASVPQAALGQLPRGYVSPALWDPGVTAALLNYNFNAYRTDGQGGGQTQAYLGLDGGANLGGWQLRNQSTLTWRQAARSAPGQRRWQSVQSYLQRDLAGLGARLTVGDSYTDGQVFPSFAVRGVQLATDDRMLPDSQRGFAPVVRGVAVTNALVSVRQNGVQIYQATVAPGAFAIGDLYPTGYGGDLEVTVTEADGRIHSFSVPYASVAQLLRPGIIRFSLAAGQLHDASLARQPAVLQAAAQRGLSNAFTAYAGAVAAQGYAAALLGQAVNTRLGALALNLAQARTRLPGRPTRSGQSLWLSYNKVLPATDTTITVTAYPYAGSGYLGLADAALARSLAYRGQDPFRPADVAMPGRTAADLLDPTQLADLAGNGLGGPIVATAAVQRPRRRLDFTLDQRLGQRGGSLYATASAADYWGPQASAVQFQLGYDNSVHGLTYGLSATRTRDASGRDENEYFLNLSLPLGDGPHAPNLLLNLDRDTAGDSQEQLMLNGSLGADSQFNYGATAAHSESGGNAATLNAGYRGPYAVLTGSYGEGRDFTQSSLGVSGAIVAHPGGVTFGQPTGDTAGIVYAPGAGGARLDNATGVRVDRGGYALVPYLTPYLLNTVQIDPKGLPLDVQVDTTSAQVAPYAGAVVLLTFKTRSGRSLIVRARLADGRPVPFGAQVFDPQGNDLGVVGQAGRMLVRGAPAAGRLDARWQDADGSDRACAFDYRTAAPGRRTPAASPEEIDVTCQSSASAPAATARP